MISLPRGDFKDFTSTKKEALDEEREEQRLIHQEQIDKRFESRYAGDPDLQPTVHQYRKQLRCCWLVSFNQMQCWPMTRLAQ